MLLCCIPMPRFFSRSEFQVSKGYVFWWFVVYILSWFNRQIYLLSWYDSSLFSVNHANGAPIAINTILLQEFLPIFSEARGLRPFLFPCRLDAGFSCWLKSLMKEALFSYVKILHIFWLKPASGCVGWSNKSLVLDGCCRCRRRLLPLHFSVPFPSSVKHSFCMCGRYYKCV